MKAISTTTTITLRGPLLRGERRPRIALVGSLRAGKSTIFGAASSPAVHHERLAGLGGSYQECIVEVGLDQISLVDLPSMSSLHHLSEHDRVVLMYLLWGDRWPPIARHEDQQPVAAFSAPDVLVQVVDATTLERDLELSLELSLLGRPMVIALNRLDEARDKGMFVNVALLAERLGVRVVPTIAHMGKGITDLFAAVLQSAREKNCPVPQSPSGHIVRSLEALDVLLSEPQIEAAFQVPRPLLLAQLAENDDYFLGELRTHFPALVAPLVAAREAAEAMLPRSLSEEVHADRHHRAAMLFESVTSPRGPDTGTPWKRWLDEFFLHPRWGMLGTLAVFAAVLFVVFEISTSIDAVTSAPLGAWVQEWQPTSLNGVLGRAVADGLVGLIGIVLPYMLPLVLLLVALEESGIMHRVAFVVDRGFHRIGLHGGVAVPFLIGLGCNVPAISAAAATSSGRERLVAALLITFVPCSARSAIILALGGKYLGSLGVLAIFLLTLVVIALLGRLLARRFASSAPGSIQEIPPYSLPTWGKLWRKTWERTSDIVTIVTPLLVLGSIVLALLNHFGADDIINTALTPITYWWLGLPVVLGVPILFGVLRKELSLLMIYQALGTQEIGPLLNGIQIFTFLVFMTFYVPCLSTFAVMLKVLGRREAWFSVGLSVGGALLVAGLIRLVLELGRAVT
jgi:ferrous iron transport protein B